MKDYEQVVHIIRPVFDHNNKTRIKKRDLNLFHFHENEGKRNGLYSQLLYVFLKKQQCVKLRVGISLDVNSKHEKKNI